MKLYNIFIYLSILLMLSCEEDERVIPNESLQDITIELTAPKTGYEFEKGEEVLLSAKLKGVVNQDLNSLKAIWGIKEDTILYNGPLNNDYTTSFKWDNPSREVHDIFLSIKNSKGDSLFEGIKIYPKASLYTIDNLGRFPIIKWPKVFGSQFKSYNLVRNSDQGNNAIKSSVFSSQISNDTVLIDSSAYLNGNYYYTLNIEYKDGKSSQSEEVMTTLQNNATSLDSISAKIISLVDNGSTSPTDSILFFGGAIAPSYKDLTGLRAIWKSDKDGILHTGKLNENRITSFYSDKLTKDKHIITLEIRNEEDSLVSDAVTIYNTLKLFPLEPDNESISLRWTSFDNKDFIAYRILRSTSRYNIDNGDIIYETTDPRDTTFIDTSVNLGTIYYYTVYAEYSGIPLIQSRRLDKRAGIFIEVDFPIHKIIKDPFRNRIYGIADRPNSDNKTGYGLFIIDTDNLELERRMFINTRFSDMEIDDTGDYLYLASRQNKVIKLDLNTYEISKIITLEEKADKIQISSERLIYVTTKDLGRYLRLHDVINNQDIPQKTPYNRRLGFEKGDFELLPITNDIIYGGSGNSSTSLWRIAIENDSIDVLKEWDSGDWGSENIVIDSQNERIFWHAWMFNYDLERIGIFLDDGRRYPMMAVSPRATVMLTRRGLYNTSNQEKIKRIPAEFGQAAFLNENQVILTTTTSPLHNEYESFIFLYSF